MANLMVACFLVLLPPLIVIDVLSAYNYLRLSYCIENGHSLSESSFLSHFWGLFTVTFGPARCPLNCSEDNRAVPVSCKGNPFASATITMDKSNEPESIESYLNRLSSAKLPSNLDERRNSSKLSWTNINGITTTWLIVIIIIAAIAFLIIIGCCYICLFKGNKDLNKKRLANKRGSSGSSYFPRQAQEVLMARSVSASKGPYVPVYSIPMNNGENNDKNNNPKNQQDDIEIGLSRQHNGDISTGTGVSSIGKFRAVGRATGHIAASAASTVDAGYDVLKQAEGNMSFDRKLSKDIPTHPAVYEPPSTAELKTLDSEEEEGEGEEEEEDRTDEDEDSENEEEPKETMTDVKEPESAVNNVTVNDPVNEKKEAKEEKQTESEEKPTVQPNTATNANKNLLLQDEKTTEEKMMQMMPKSDPPAEKSPENENPEEGRVRLMSAGIQTSPTIWFGLKGVKGTVNLKQTNSIDWEPHPIYSDPFALSAADNRTERCYFIYIVSESSPYFRKNCIGKITLPAGSSITLSELREYLTKADDDQLKEIIKRDKSFRFLTETYRFVAQNEAIVSIDQVYPTQGIFIKLSAPDFLNPIGRSKSRPSLTGRRSPQPPPSRPQPPPSKPHPPSTSTPNLVHASKARSEKPTVFKERLPRRINFDQFDDEKPKYASHFNRTRIADVSHSNPHKQCSNTDCSKPGILKCIRCAGAYYCSVRCKNDHRNEHRFVCSRPPWRF